MPSRSWWTLNEIAVAALTVLAWPAASHALDVERYEVRAIASRATGRLAIEETITLRLDADETEIALWSYGDRLREPPRAMEERSYRWIYPGEVDRGRYDLGDIRVEGAVLARAPSIEPHRERPTFDAPAELDARDRGGSLTHLELEPADHPREVVIRLRVDAYVPDRFGRMGRARGELALAAPWYPLVWSEGGYEHVVPHDVSLRSADDDSVLLAGTSLSATQAHSVERAAYLPALILPATFEARARRVLGHTLIFVDGHRERASAAATRGDARSEDGLHDLLEIDVDAHLVRAFEDVVRTASLLGLSLPEPFVVATVPSRTELAATAPPWVLLSDRAFQVTPLDVVLDFHRRALRRAMFMVVADQLSGLEAVADRGWARDLRSIALADLDELRRAHASMRPDQLLSIFAFHPAVDQFLYAPQITFDEVYFGAIDEPDVFRDDPVRARRALVRGRRLLESMRDVLEDDEATTFLQQLAIGRRSVRETFHAVAPSAPDRFDVWLAYPTLEVNYRLGDISSRRDGSDHLHTVEVLRDGASRTEPIVVEVADDAGHHVRGELTLEGTRGIIELRTPSSRHSVELDPDHRLPQAARIADGHPRGDDATDRPYRPPLLNAFALDVLLSESNITGLVDVALRQRYDLEHTWSLRLARSAARTGGRLRYAQGIGPKAHNNRRIATLGGGIGFHRVEANFGMGGTTLGGWAADIDVTLGVDTQRFFYDPREGFHVGASLIASGTYRDDQSITGSLRGTLSAGLMVPVSLLNAFLFAASASFSAGQVLNAELQSIGGRYALRGFANDELLGRGVVFGVIEHRYTVLSDLAINVFHGVWGRELQLATWVGAGGVFGALDGRDAVFAMEAGIGLRGHYEYGGVQPGVIALDFGFPISRYVSETGGGRQPIGFYLSFDQYF